MYIRLKIAVCAILLSATMFSCTKEEMVAEPLHKGPEIGFGVNLGWEADKIGTKSGYGKKQGEFVLRSSELEDTLAVGVYVQNGINLNEEPKTKGAVTSSENLDKFGVWCQLTNGNNESISYFSNLEVSRDLSSGVCSSDTYYWPGSNFTRLEFLAVGPYAPEGLTPDNTILPTSFTYTVPEEAVDQTDIIIATPKYSTESAAYPGNYGNQISNQINLNFNHILSAINVKVGDIPGGGVINSVSIKNLHNAGTYTVATGAWTVTSESPTASYTIENTVEVNENTQSGTQINPENATFMLLPQTLTENAVLEVNFTHALTNNNVTLSGKIADITPTWTKGNSYNYLINIAPDYTLSITEENVAISDCHYDTKIINITNEYSQVNWTLSSDVDWIKFRLVPADYETNENYAAYRDYWIGNHIVKTINITIDQTTEKTEKTESEEEFPIISQLNGYGNAKVLIYYYENIQTSTDNTRVATIYLKDEKGNLKDEILVHQFNPIWNGNLAYERIEEKNGSYPWGFSSTRIVSYSYPDLTPSWAKSGIGRLVWILLSIFQLQDWFLESAANTRGEVYSTFYTEYATSAPAGFITITPSGGDGSTEWGKTNNWSVKLDYSKLNTINAIGTGAENTKKILTYTGGATGSDAETYLVSYMTKGTESNTSDATTIPETAAYQAVKKNYWILNTTITNTTTITSEYDPQHETKTAHSIELYNDNIQWFLPSNGEIADLKSTAWDGDPDNNNDEPLTGTYWTSTSGSGTTAYYYAADATTGTAVSRVSTTKHKVRAARSKN